jgi:hypothetical protein
MSYTQSLDTAATSVTGISSVSPLSEADPNRIASEKAFRANDLTDFIANAFTSCPPCLARRRADLFVSHLEQLHYRSHCDSLRMCC